MNDLRTQEAVRVALSALLSTELGPRHLHEIAGSLTGESKFITELRNSLNAVLDALYHKRKLRSTSDVSDLERRVFQAIKTRRLSKKDVIEIIRNLAPGLLPDDINETVPMRRIISNFLLVAPESLRSHFINMLGAAAVKDDPYLKGLIQREK